MEQLTPEQTKLQIIKDAYGKYYEQCEPDEHGWTKWTNTTRFSSLEFCNKRNLMRPLSLKGIEDNNGWKAIESVEDLPKERGLYWVIDKFMEQQPRQIVFFDPNYSESTIERWLHRFTDYQLVVQPLDKIY